MSAYDPTLLVILDTLTRPGIDGFRAEVYRYADGGPKVRFCRSNANAKGEWRKVDAFSAADLVDVAELCGPARVALSLRAAPPVPTVDPRIAALEAEIAALRAAVPTPVARVGAELAAAIPGLANIPNVVVVPVSALVKAPAPTPAPVRPASNVRPSVSDALSALGVS